jgi:hypothetical protein
MALISCLTRPDGLQGVFSCLSIGQGLSGSGVDYFTGRLAGDPIPGRGETCTADPGSQTGNTRPPAQFGNARHASAVHDFANQNYYQVMLAEMEKALFSAGYELTQDASRADTAGKCRQTRYQPKSDQRSPPLYDPFYQNRR